MPRLTILALITLISALTTASETEGDDWGYWLLVKLPAVEVPPDSNSKTGRAKTDPSGTRLSKEKITLQSQRMSSIKTAYQSDYSHLRDVHRLIVHGFNEKGTVVFTTSVRDPRVLRMETVDNNGNLIYHGTIRRGAAVVSVPVPEKDVVRIELSSQAVDLTTPKGRPLVTVGKVDIK